MLSLAALSLLAVLWMRNFCPAVNIGRTLLLAVCLLLIFKQPIFAAVRSANFAIFEALLLWLALLALRCERPVLFLFPLLLASFFKVTPVVLSLTFFCLPKWRRHLPGFAAGMLLGLVVWLGPLLTSAELFRSYVHYASTILVLEKGVHFNLSSYAFISDLLSRCGVKHNSYPALAYLLSIMLCGLGTVVVLRKLNWERDKDTIIFLALLAYALTMPRFKDYAFIQLIPIAFSLSLRYPLLILLNISPLSLFAGDADSALGFLTRYEPLLIVFINWCFLMFLCIRLPSIVSVDRINSA